MQNHKNRKARVSTPFEALDENIKAVEKSPGKEVFAKPVDSKQMQQELQKICVERAVPEENWAAIADAEEKVRAKELNSRGLPSVCIEKVVIDPPSISVPAENNTNHPLPYRIALVMEWKDGDAWKNQRLTIMHTVEDFGRMMGYLRKQYGCTGGFFTSCLQGCSPETMKIFNEVQKIRDHKQAGPKIQHYNNQHPIFAFVQLSDDIKDIDTIPIPFQRVDGRVINEVSINVKSIFVDDDLSTEISPIDDDFELGIIPGLVLGLIGGTINQNITSVVFSSTIVMDHNRYRQGNRVRIITNASEKVETCRKYLEEEFIPHWNTHIQTRIPDAPSIEDCIVQGLTNRKKKGK